MSFLSVIKRDVITPATVCVAGLFILWGVFLFPQIWTAVQVWLVSETFTHCFFVIPGSIYLAWRERYKLSRLKPKPNYWVMLLVLPALVVGLFGMAGDVQVVVHFAIFSLLPLLLWMMLGNAIAKAIWFPLIFVLLSVPVGDELIPLFQQVTADIAIVLLNWVGVPVFRNGLYLDIPAGRFFVAEACSGIRFFVASIAFGAVYAHLSYQSLQRKFLFMCLAVVVPIIANGLRVFGIILIGHLSDMEYAAGADHLIYGWVFFAIVMLLLIFVGEFWRDLPVADKAEGALVVNEGWRSKGLVVPLLISLLILSVWAVWGGMLQRSSLVDERPIDLGELSGVTESSVANAPWQPQFQGYSDSVQITVEDDFLRLDAFAAWYPYSGGRSELIASANRLYRDRFWSLASSDLLVLDDGSTFNRLTITNPAGEKRWLIYWYVLSERELTSAPLVKFYQAYDKLSGGAGAGAVIAISLPVNIALESKVKGFLHKNVKVFREALPFKERGVNGH